MRVSFLPDAEVTEYSRGIGHHRIPTDGSDLAIGLGKPVSKKLLPLRNEPQAVNCCAYLPEEERARVLRGALPPGRFLRVVSRHCRETAEVIKMRQESFEDEEEPRADMPGSYAEAIERASKVAAEAQAPFLLSSPPISILSASVKANALLSPNAKASRLTWRKRQLSSADITRACKLVRISREAVAADPEPL